MKVLILVILTQISGPMDAKEKVFPPVYQIVESVEQAAIVRYQDKLKYGRNYELYRIDFDTMEMEQIDIPEVRIDFVRGSGPFGGE